MNLLVGDEIAVLQEAYVALPQYTAGLHLRLGDIHVEPAAGTGLYDLTQSQGLQGELKDAHGLKETKMRWSKTIELKPLAMQTSVFGVLRSTSSVDATLLG